MESGRSMSLAAVCDLCHKPYKKITGDEGTQVPVALYVEMAGEVLVEYNDLCPSCAEKERKRVLEGLTTVPRHRKSKKTDISEDADGE